MPPRKQKELSAEDLDALPVISHDELDALPVIGSDDIDALPTIGAAPVSEDTLTESHPSILGSTFSKIPEQAKSALSSFISLFSSPDEVAKALLAPGTSEPVLPGAGPTAPTGVQVIDQVLRRPNLTRAVGSGAGALAGTMVGNPYVGALLGGTAGDFLSGQLNQGLGTTPDTPIREDISDSLAGGVVNAAMSVPFGLGNKALLDPTRQAATRAARDTTIGSKLLAPKGTTNVHTILAEDMKRHTPEIVRLNPFRNVDAADPNAMDHVMANTASIKEALNKQKTALLARADRTGQRLRLEEADIDQAVANARSQGINVSDDAATWAKEHLRETTTETSPLLDPSGAPIETKLDFSPSEFQEYMRRKIADERTKLGLDDASSQAKMLVDESFMAQFAAKKQGLSLLRSAADAKLERVIPGEALPQLNRGISAMIDLEDQLRMANAGVAGTEVVTHGSGVPRALSAGEPGWLRRAIGNFLPSGITNRLLTDYKTRQSMNMQAQMINPIQEFIRHRTGTTTPIETALLNRDRVTQLLGGDMARGMVAANLIPRNSEQVMQNPELAAMAIGQAMMPQALRMTGGNQEIASAIVGRTVQEFRKVAQRGSPVEVSEMLSALSAKFAPEAFAPGEYPDEMDGHVFDPMSKMQMAENAKLQFDARAVDSISYAKQMQEAWRGGPARIIIRKNGQRTPDQIPQGLPPADAQAFAAANMVG